MTGCRQETLLLAARELLVTVGQEQTSFSGQQQAHVQEAIEHLDDVRQSIEGAQ